MGSGHPPPHPDLPVDLFSPLGLPCGRRGAGVWRRPLSHDERWTGRSACVRARSRTGLGPWRGSLGAAGATASRDWERGWSKNVSYSSVFLPGPAPPLPPNKPFPIAQLAYGPPVRPSPGLQDPDPPPRSSQTPGAAAPSAAPSSGIAALPRPEPPTSASPRGRALDSGRGGRVGSGPELWEPELQPEAPSEAGVGVGVGWGRPLSLRASECDLASPDGKGAPREGHARS